MSPKGQSVVKVMLGLMVFKADKMGMVMLGMFGKKNTMMVVVFTEKCFYFSHKAFHVFITPLQMTNCLTLGAVKLPFQL